MRWGTKRRMLIVSCRRHLDVQILFTSFVEGAVDIFSLATSCLSFPLYVVLRWSISTVALVRSAHASLFHPPGSVLGKRRNCPAEDLDQDEERSSACLETSPSRNYASSG